MRPQFIFAILLVGLLSLAGVFFLKQHSVKTLKPVVKPMPVVAPQSNHAPPIPVIVKKNMTPEEKKEAIEAEQNRLYTWAMNNDRQSLSNILGDLVSPEKEICMTAIEAVKEFGDTNAIPVLKALAANTDDTEEAIAMLEAVQFLSIPSIVSDAAKPPKTPAQAQLDAQRQAAKNARRQAILHKGTSSQANSQIDQNSTSQPSAQP